LKSWAIPPCELADRLEPLRLRDPGPEGVGFGLVDDLGHDAEGPAVGILQARGVDLDERNAASATTPSRTLALDDAARERPSEPAD